MRFGQFQLSVIRECTFKLDGGAMFGVVPKPLWSRALPADELNRVLLACNLLLIETPSGRVLVETGMGDRWPDRERDRYEVVEEKAIPGKQRIVLRALAGHGPKRLGGAAFDEQRDRDEIHIGHAVFESGCYERRDGWDNR